MWPFFSGFTVLLIIPAGFNLLTILRSQYSVVYSLGLLQYLLEIRGGQRPMIAIFLILTG